MDPEELDRVAAPIGLDLGAVSPEETALSILAEVVAVRHGRQGGRPQLLYEGKIACAVGILCQQQKKEWRSVDTAIIAAKGDLTRRRHFPMPHLV